MNLKTKTNKELFILVEKNAKMHETKKQIMLEYLSELERMDGELGSLEEETQQVLGELAERGINMSHNEQN